MRRARLLHSPERVEVLHIDTCAGVATILRHGFEQRVPLQDIVLDEEETPAPVSPSLSAERPEELELVLHTRLTENKAELHLRHGYSSPGFYVIYIQTSRRTWMPILNRMLSSGEAAFLSLSLEQYPPPWLLLLQRLELPQAAVATPPVLHTVEVTVRLATFMREGGQKLSAEPEIPASQKSERRELTASSAITAAPEIDLHIEVLAPEMKGSPAEAIFDYQVQCMKRYLYACEHARQPSAVVIHGVGKKRLHGVLVELCKAEGWRLEPLLVPPYLGGATRVYFT